jgi:hypothetical protein
VANVNRYRACLREVLARVVVADIVSAVLGYYTTIKRLFAQYNQLSQANIPTKDEVRVEISKS